ncbi:hypothetical protein CGRA01v4_06670 [Colletotrichum graminicola]|nr:hypothetical protein CGRA01v4_06670 [Colletotrichum graminicola]
MPCLPFTTRIWTTLAHTDAASTYADAVTLLRRPSTQSRPRSGPRTGRIDCPVPFRILARLVDGRHEFISLEHRSRLEELSSRSFGIARPAIYTYPSSDATGCALTQQGLILAGILRPSPTEKTSPTLPRTASDVQCSLLLRGSHQSDHRS